MAARRSPRTLAQFGAYSAVIQAAEALRRGVVELLRTEDLSPAQYNVLRVLRGAAPDGLACGAVAERLVTWDPDVTRLMDRLVGRGLVSRTRDAKDRRVVVNQITDAGLALLARLDGPLDELHETQLGHMEEPRLELLAELLDEARSRVPE